MKSILFFHPKNDYTGSTRVLADVIARDYAGQSVDIIVNRNHGKGFLSELPNVQLIGYCVPTWHGKRIPVVAPLVWRIHFVLLTLCLGWRYNTFYINTITPYLAALLGRLYGKKVIYHIHEKFVQQTLSVRIMEWIFAHTKAHRIFVSRYTRDSYPDNPSCTSTVCYNHLGKQFLDRVDIKPIGERKRNTVLMIASLSKVKGLSTFMAVAELLPDLHFRLMLSADMESIQAYLEQSIPKNVELIPAQSNIHPYLREADLMLNLSNPFLCVETFGMTILEAMAYGVPSIAPNIGGPIELIEDGYNGFCVDVTDTKVVAEKIKEVLGLDNYERFADNALAGFERFR